VTAGALRVRPRRAETRLRAEALARELNWSPRHLQRLLGAEAGLTPHRLIRFLRLHGALKELAGRGGTLSAIAARVGYPSLRAFEEDARAAFGAVPRLLRCAARTDAGRLFWGPSLELRWAYRGPFDVRHLIGFLSLRAVPGLEEGDVERAFYRRVLRLPAGVGLVSMEPPPDERSGRILVKLHLENVSDLPAAVSAVRAIMDLDADTDAVGRVLGADAILGPWVRAFPGLRVPGHADGAELAIRAVLGQQVSLAAARTLTARLVRLYGTPLAHPAGSIRHLFPTPDALAAAGPDLPAMAMPLARRRAVHGLAAALAAGRVPPIVRGADPDAVDRALAGLSGIGPWTRSYIAMRALGDPDAFLAGDLGVRHGYQALFGGAAAVRGLERASEAWRPFRAYAVVLLWRVASERAAAPIQERVT